MEFVQLDPDDTPDPPRDDDAALAAWLTAPPGDPMQPHPRSTPARPKRPAGKRGAASSILMAAMIGLADALGWDRPKDEVVEVADAPIGGDGLKLDFKHLEPLD